jgi:hypothetical protein
MQALKPGQPDIHYGLGRAKSLLFVSRVSARPQGRKDLEPGYFTMGPNGMVIVATFDHG